MKKILIITFLLFTTHIMVQAQSTTLSECIKTLALKYEVSVSFNPRLTDNVIVTNSNYDKGDVYSSIKFLLDGKDFDLIKISDKYYYLKYQPKKIKNVIEDVAQKIEAVEDEEPEKIVITPSRNDFDVTSVATSKNETLQDVGEKSMGNMAKVISEPIGRSLYMPKLAIKTNILYDILPSINIGAEVKLCSKWTMDAYVNINAWKRGVSSFVKHVAVQPELRYWLCNGFNGHFFAGHIFGAYYDVSNVKLLKGISVKDVYKDTEKKGWLAGVGVGYGYQLPIAARWSLEGEIGLGYARWEYDSYDRTNDNQKIGHSGFNYWGLTKLAVSVMYFIK